ncbi:MAG TPA: PIN domain-containing protein [Gemmatimonadales bacterium]
MASFTVVLDACVLYPAPLRDLLIRLTVAGIVRARWSDAILDEMTQNILKNREDLDAAALTRTRTLMCKAVPDCLVTGYQRLIEAIELPDPKDRHVVAAAVRAGAQAIVTYNLKDFPDHELERWNIEAKHPDEFVMESIDIARGIAIRCLVEQAADLKKPPQTPEDILARLHDLGLIRSVAALRAMLQ